MRIPRVFVHVLLAAVAAATMAQQQVPPGSSYGERAFVTAIELMVRVTDAAGQTPSDLTPADFTVLEDGAERTVIGVEYLAPQPVGPGQEEAPAKPPRWELVLWIDGTTTSQRSLVTLTRELAQRSAELTSLGAVTVVWANPRPEIVLAESEDASVITDRLRAIGRRSASDQIARIRRETLDNSDQPSAGRNPATPTANFARRVLAAAREEARAIRAARLAALDWLAGMPRRPQRALFLVGDGFDLDPAEFYLDLISGSADPTIARLVPTLRDLRQTEEHEEFVRALAVEGWTVIGVGGTGTTYFPDDSSRAGGNRMTEFLGPNPGSRPPGLLQSNPREPFLQAAEATGGSVIPHAGKLSEAVGDLQNRIRLTYQVPRAPDGEPRKVEVIVHRNELTVAAPKWASSTTTSSLAKGRAIRLLGSVHELGDFPVEVSLELGKADRQGSRQGVVIARANLESFAKAIPLSSTPIRVTVAVGGTEDLPFVAQQSFPASDLATDAVVEWSAPIAISKDQTKVSVVVEHLSTGAWGGATWLLSEGAVKPEPPDAGLSEALSAMTTEGVDRVTWTFNLDEALKRAAAEKKPVFRMVYTSRCAECLAVAHHLSHPAAQRALQQYVLLLTHAVERGEPRREPRVRNQETRAPAPRSHRWREGGSGGRFLSGGLFHIYDPSGNLHYEMPFKKPTPRGVATIDTEDVIGVLQRFGEVGSLLVEGAKLQQSGDELGAARAFATAYRRAGESKRAREAYERVLELTSLQGDRAAEQSAAVLLGLIEIQDGNFDGAMQRFREIEADPAGPLNHAEALLGIGQVLRARGEEAKANEAFVNAARLAPEGSEARAAALTLAASSRDVIHGAVALTPAAAIKPLQLVLRGRPPFSGRIEIQALVRRPEIDRVTFSLEGTVAAEDTSPPFHARIDLGEIPRPVEIRASGFDRSGQLIAEDVLQANTRHDQFVVDLSTGPMPQGLQAKIDLTVPLGRQIARVDLTLDGSLLERLTSPPWRAIVDRAVGETSVLRAVATLDDGTAMEDALLLDPAGLAEEIEVHDVQVFASVLDRRGEPVRDLAADDFELFENGRRKPINGFEFLEGSAWTAGLAIDSSASMTDEMPDVREAARSFLKKTVERGGQAFIVDFDGAPRLAMPTSSDFAAFDRALDNITAGGSTSLYDAIVFGLIQLHGASGKRALIVLSDGEDVRSRYDHEQAIRVAKESGAAIYVIVIDERGWIFGSQRLAGRWERLRFELEELTRETGGRAWYLRSAEGLMDIYDQVDRELRNQYLLTYRTAPTSGETEWRTIRVDVKRPGLTARTISGFFAR